MNKRIFLFGLIALMLIAGPVSGYNAILDNYNNMVVLTIDADTISEDLTDFPVMIKLGSDSGIDNTDTRRIFDELGSDANRKKIAISDVDGNILYTEIKEWSTSTKTAYLWVKVPVVSSTEDTILYLFYDKNAPANTGYVGDVGETPAQQVWTNGYAGVWHTSSGSQLLDSTPNKNHGTIYGATVVNGPIGNCLSFNGANNYVQIPHKTSLNLNTLTMDMFLNFKGVPSSHSTPLIAKQKSGSYIGAYWIEYRDDGTISSYVRTGGIDHRAVDISSNLNSWYIIDATYNGNALITYKDGILVGTCSVSGNVETTSDPLSIAKGGLGRNYGSKYSNVIIAMTSLSSVARTTSWVNTNDKTLNDNLIGYNFVIQQPDFISDTTITSTDQSIQFIDQSILYFPRLWQWDFGDGSTSTLQNPTHIYKKPGIYTVSLTVADTTGEDTITKINYITVVPSHGDPIKINFQPQSMEDIPDGHLIDYGQTYRNMGGNASWGWSVDSTQNAVERNIHTDKRLDSFVSIPSNDARTWEFDVPDGYYIVRMSIGDALKSIDHPAIYVEGKQYWDSGTSNTFKIKSDIVYVNDGKITVSTNGGSGETCINYIEISPAIDKENFQYYQKISYSCSDVDEYQQDVIIHRGTGTAYQETVGGLNVWHIYVGNKCKTDYGDIRFTDIMGNDLSYYLWPDYDSNSAKVTIKLENAKNAGSVDIWYGNSGATTTSNSDNVFIARDLTKFLKVDPDNKLSINSDTEIQLLGLASNSDAYIYKGVDERSTGRIDLTVYRTGGSTKVNGFGVANVLDDCRAASPGAFVIYPYSSNFRFWINNALSTAIVQSQDNVPKYITLIYNGNTVTCNIYSDAKRETLLKTQSIAWTSSWQYIYAVSSFNDGKTSSITGYIRDFSVREYSAIKPSMTTVSNEMYNEPKSFIDLSDFSNNRFKITIPENRVSEDLFEFPALIKLSDESGITDYDITAIFDAVGTDENRKRIAVTDNDGNDLFVEIKEWNTDDKTAYLWVYVPVIYSDKPTHLYLYYGGDVDTDNVYVGDTGERVAQEVWTNGYAGVWHTSSNGYLLDSSSNENHGTIYGATEVDGPFGKALSYDGVSNKMEITEHTGITGANSNMLITTQFLTTNTNKTSQAIAGVWEGGSGELSWFLEITDANMIRFGISESGYPNYSIWQWNNSLNNNKWYTLSVFWEDNEHAILYIDGVEQDRINTPDLVSSINPSDYKYMVGVMNRYFSGSMSTTMINVDNPFITHSWVSTAHKSLTDNLFEYGPAGPEAEFTIEKSDVFIGYPVQFNDTSENDPTVWNWSFGDGKFSNEQHPFHIYEIPGNYTVLLNASNDDGFGSIYKSNCVRVRDVTFDVNRTIGVAPMPISFMDTTDGNVTGWTWVFDDGGVSTEQNPVHVYLNPGEYDATLIATTEDGPVATSKRIIIHDNYTTGHLPGYTDRFTLIINKTDTSFTDIPVKIVISENSGNNGYNISKIFDVLGDNRKKIAITREDGVTQQYVEIERWDSINREAVLWTKIPHINTEHDTVLYLNYGAEVVDNTEYVGDIGSKPANEVWSNGYYSVWHMVDESGVVRDSTKNNYDGIINGPISSGGGLSFNGISDHIVIGDTYLPSDLTIEADVIFTPDKNGNNIIVSKRSVYGRSVGRLTLSRTDNITDMNFDAWDFDTYPGLKSGLANIVLPSQEERYIIGGSRDASDTVGFSDGEVFAQITTNFTLPLDPYKNDTLSIGAVCYDAGTISEAFNGTINDIRISHVPRSESWMSVMYQSDMDMLFAYYATPVANFTANRTEINEGWDIQFNNTSLEEHDTWRWDFGDGTTSDLENPLKTYDMFGNYTVALTITGIGGTDSITKTDYIIVHNATPVADFALNRSEVNEFWPIQFNDMSTGTIHSLIWDFGDGSGSNDPNPVHMYPEFGTYTVNLTVSNDGGYSSHEKIITVHNTTPVSEFSANRTEVNEYWPIKFTNSATGTVHDYLWNFGNGVTSTEANPVYAYPDYGLYTVRLTVSNDGGSHYDEKTQYILVHNATPIINDFTASDIEVEYPVSIKFTPDITGVVHSVYWDFGDGQGSTDRSPSHTYTYAGTFTVELDVSNDGGQDAKIKTNYIKILSHYPTTGFATNYAGDRTVRFTDKSSVGEFDEPITEYYWDFGDGMISTEKNPVHFFQSLGQGSPYYNYFEVTHGSKNARGWTYVTKTVEVINEPNYIPVPPDRDTSVKWSPSTATYISMWWKSDNQNLDPGAFLESMTSAIQEHTKGLGIVMILFAVFLFLAVAYGDYAIALVMFVLAIPSITPDLLPIDFHIPMIVLVGILAAAVIYRTIKAVLEL